MAEGTTGVEPRGSAAGSDGVVGRLATELGQRMYRAVGLVFLFALVFHHLEAVTHVLLIGFIGVIVGIAFNAAVVRLPLSRGWSTALVALATLVTIATGVWFGISVLSRQLRALVSDMPSLLSSIEEWEAWLQETTGIDLALLGPRVESITSGILGGVDGGMILSGAFGFIEIVALSVLVLMGAFFIVARPNEQLLNPIMRAVPRARRPAFRRMLALMAERLSGWLWGTLLSMIIIGTLSSIVFALLGTPYPVLLGVLVGVMDIIPLVGPWIGGGVAVLVTLLHEPGLALWVGVAVLAIQETEGNLIRPVVMSSSAELHPFVTLLALLLFAAMFGILGAILSLPLVLAIGTIVEVFWVEETLGAGDDEIGAVVQP